MLQANSITSNMITQHTGIYLTGGHRNTHKIHNGQKKLLKTEQTILAKKIPTALYSFRRRSWSMHYN